MVASGTRPRNRTLHILLATMPWASVDIPSLALGILRRAVREQYSDTAVEILYGNLKYVDWITERCAFEATDYSHFSFEVCHTGSEERRRFAYAMDALAPAIADDITRRILDWGPDVVGFTSAFQQKISSLAMAWRPRRCTR